MSVLPKELYVIPKRDLVEGIETEVIRISPVAATSSTEFNQSNRRITFRIPSIAGSMLDPSGTYIQFKITLEDNTKKFINCPFREFLLKSSNGKILERIQNYDHYFMMKSMERHNADYDQYLHKINKISSSAEGKVTYVCSHTLESGLMSEYNGFLPMGSLDGYAYELTLELDSNKAKYTDGNVAKFTDVALFVKTCMMPPAIMNQYIEASQNVELNYETVTEHQHAYNGLTSTQTIHDANVNVTRIDTIFVDDTDQQTLLRNYVQKYQCRYANKYYPLESIDNTNGNLASLLYTISQVGKRITGLKLTDGWTEDNNSNATFRISQTFKKSKDPLIMSGLNTLSTSAPIEIRADFCTVPTGGASQEWAVGGVQSGTMITFVKKAYKLTVINGKFEIVDDLACSCK